MLLADPPKGFEKYFPGKSSSKSSNESENKFDFKKTETSGGGNKGTSSSPDQQNQQRNFLILALGAGILMAISYYNDRFKEITWRDFVNDYLSKGSIDRLEVVNKKWVRILLRNPEQVMKIFFSVVF